MSRTKEVADIAQNPAELAFFYNGQTGVFGYPNPNEGQDGFVDLAELPPMILLDGDAFCVSGKTTSGEKIKSNTAHRGYDQNLTVWLKDSREQIAFGTWGQIKPTVTDKRGKYTVQLYFLTQKGKIVVMYLTGRALAEWLKFSQANSQALQSSFVFTQGRTDVPGSQGKIGSKVPVFKLSPCTDTSLLNQADEADRTLQAYFKAYFEQRSQPQEAQTTPAYSTTHPTQNDNGYWPSEPPRTTTAPPPPNMSANGFNPPSAPATTTASAPPVDDLPF